MGEHTLEGQTIIEEAGTEHLGIQLNRDNGALCYNQELLQVPLKVICHNILNVPSTEVRYMLRARHQRGAQG